MKIVPLDDASWSDDRGWGLAPLEAAGVDPLRLGGVHVVSLEPGAVRGNHVHTTTTEWMVVFGGSVTLAARLGQGAVEERRLEGPGPALVVFGPGEAHAVRGEGPGTAYLLCYADGTPVTDRVEPPLLS